MDLILALTTVAIVVASIVFDWWYSLWLRSKRLPPGPTPWPVVGNLFQLRRGLDFLSTLASFGAKYGNIVTLWIGKRPIIFVSDAALAYDALMKQGTFFANRPKLESQRILSTGFLTLHSSEGALTNALRKNVMTHILGPAKLKAYKRLREAAYEDIIKIVELAAASKHGVAEVNVSSITRYHLFNFAYVLSFGVKLEEDLVQEIIRLLMVRVKLGFSFHLGDYISAWRIFEGKSRRIKEDMQKRSEELLGPIIDRLRTLQCDENSVIGGNYCETLFQLEKEFPALNNSTITSLCCEFINGAVHTTTGAVDLALALLSEHPEVQRRLFHEIQGKVRNRPVEESDLPELPYLSAVVKETLRKNRFAPTTIPHATSELRKLGGYDIPTDAVIYFALYEFHHDSNHWPDALAFKPERFLETNVDVLGTGDFNFLPFSAGRRLCPGVQLAMLEVSVVVARMVQSFEWSKLSSAEKGDSEPGRVLRARSRSV